MMLLFVSSAGFPQRWRGSALWRPARSGTRWRGRQGSGRWTRGRDWGRARVLGGVSHGTLNEVAGGRGHPLVANHQTRWAGRGRFGELDDSALRDDQRMAALETQLASHRGASGDGFDTNKQDAPNRDRPGFGLEEFGFVTIGAYRSNVQRLSHLQPARDHVGSPTRTDARSRW